VLLEEIVWNGRDNTIELSLSVDGAAITHTSITRALLIVGATTLDSNTTPAYFDFTQADRLILKLGAAGLTVARTTARLIIYDASHANGLVWGDLILDVRA
jgi:hypothetical protein